MTAQELNTYINRVLGNSIRCLLPSYWWKRLLTRIVEYVDTTVTEVKEEVDDVSNKIKKVFGITFTPVEDGWFDVQVDFKKVVRVDTIPKKIRVNTSFYLYQNRENVKSIDLSLFDSSKMTSMENMFKDCINLTHLDASYLDTSNVVSMKGMFENCEKLQYLDIESFDTSNVTDMERMFYKCGDENNINKCFITIYNFNTSKVTNMRNMFQEANLWISGFGDFNTSKVTDMGGMFAYSNFNYPYVTLRYDTSNVRNMDSMFSGFNPEYLTLGSKFFKTPFVTSIDFSDNENWYESYFIDSIITNSYDRATNGLPTLEIKLHPNVYAYLTDEHKATLTSKGYVITPVSQDPDNEE